MPVKPSGLQDIDVSNTRSLRRQLQKYEAPPVSLSADDVPLVGGSKATAGQRAGSNKPTKAGARLTLTEVLLV